jgi:GGDEF domain-containing protein
MFRKRKDKKQPEEKAPAPGPNEEMSPEAMLAAAHTQELQLLGDPAYFGYRLELEIARARRYDRPVSLITFTLRHPEFPVAAPEVIDGLIGALQSQCRPSDIVGRSGYNTIGVILPETLQEQLAQVGSRLLLGATHLLNFDIQGYTVELGQAALTADHATAADLTQDAWRHRTSIPLTGDLGD